MKIIKIENTNIAYQQSGKGDKTLLFVHGNSCSHEYFTHQFNSELSKKFKLIAIDLPGHGCSDYADEKKKLYTIAGYADIICKIVHFLKLENIIYVGHSIGGHIMLQHSDRLPNSCGLVLIGTPPISSIGDLHDAFLPHPAFNLLYKKNLSQEDNEVIIDGFIGIKSGLSKIIKRSIASTDTEVRVNLGRNIQEGVLPNEIEQARKLPFPIAILNGVDDKMINKKYLNEVTDKIKWRSKIHYIKNSGHVPQWENPADFNNLLEEYITKICN